MHDSIFFLLNEIYTCQKCGHGWHGIDYRCTYSEWDNGDIWRCPCALHYGEFGEVGG